MFSMFLEMVNVPEHTTLIEGVHKGYKAIFENETPTGEWSVTESNVDSTTADVTVLSNNNSLAPMLMDKFPEAFAELSREYSETTGASLDVSLVEFSVQLNISGEMVTDGDMHGNWSYFEATNHSGVVQIIVDGDDFGDLLEVSDPVFGGIADIVITDAFESTAVASVLEKIGSETYESKPENRWAYGATH